MANTDMPAWLSQAERLENRYEELSVQISQPDVIADRRTRARGRI